MVIGLCVVRKHSEQKWCHLLQLRDGMEKEILVEMKIIEMIEKKMEKI
jgi:hypothetical protein